MSTRKRPRPKKVDRLLAKELARQTCNECGVNVIEIGEYYMLNPDIWERQLGLGWTDNLCLGCLEARLGRKISPSDMCSFPSYPWMMPSSIRLKHRLFGHLITKRPPYRLRKSVKNVSGITKAVAKAIGEYDAREAAA